MDIIKTKIFDYHIQSKTLFILYGYSKNIEICELFIIDKDNLSNYLSALANQDCENIYHTIIKDSYDAVIDSLFFDEKIPCTLEEYKIDFLKENFFQKNINLTIGYAEDTYTKMLDKLGQRLYLKSSEKLLFLLYGHYMQKISDTCGQRENIFVAKIFSHISEYKDYLKKKLKKYQNTKKQNSIAIWHQLIYNQFYNGWYIPDRDLLNMDIDKLDSINIDGTFYGQKNIYIQHKIIPIEDIKIV